MYWCRLSLQAHEAHACKREGAATTYAFPAQEVCGFLEIHNCLSGDLPVELLVGCNDGAVAPHAFVQGCHQS